MMLCGTTVNADKQILARLNERRKEMKELRYETILLFHASSSEIRCKS